MCVCVCVCDGGVTGKVADLCALAKIPTGLIQHWNGPHRAMGRSLQHNEHKGQLWHHSLQAERVGPRGQYDGLLAANGEGSLFLQHPPIRFISGDSTATRLSPGAT